MGKMAYVMKNMFKSKEQRELEARMEFNKNKRSFTKYYNELDVSVKNFSKMARDAELSGNHENAKSCALFVLKLQKTQVKVQALLQRFEMMNSMQRLAGVMSNFAEACTNMGFAMDTTINLKDMWKNTAEMDRAINKLDAMSDQMDMIFDTIDAGMSTDNEMIPSEEEQDKDAEELLRKIMGRHVTTQYAPKPEEARAEGAANPEQVTDDTDDRLRRMMEDLKG